MKNILTLLVFISALHPKSIRERAEDIIQNHFQTAITIEFKKLKLSPSLKSNVEKKARQSFYTDFIYQWEISKNAEKIAIAYLDNVLGKSLPITFLVIFDQDMKIMHSAVVKYREPYGGGVQNKNWNTQFIGKNHESSYVNGKDIASISGATISVHSMTKGVRKLALLIHEINGNTP